MKAVGLVILSVLGLGVAAKRAKRAKLGCLKGLDISLIGGKTYANATFYWNNRLTSPEPAAVVRPKKTEDVIRAVKCAAKSTSISVRSGGHSYEGYWQGNKGGVVVDLRNMKRIEVNKKKRQVTVQAGALLGNLLAKLWEEDKGVLPHGLQGNVGVGGMTLGGGFGLLSRKYGLLVDRVVSLKMVDAKGKLLSVDENNNKDLFFALRGAGGGSFGVVTEFTFSYIKHEHDFTVARYNWKAGRNNFTNIVKSIMKYYNSNPTPAAGHYLNLSPGGSIELGITYSDGQKKTKRYIRKLEKIIKKWDKKDVQRKDWINAYLFFAGYAGKPAEGNIETLRNTQPMTEQSFYKAKSGFLRKSLSTGTIRKLRNILVKPGKGLFVLIDLWGGVIPGKKGTSFANRDKYASVQIGQTESDQGKLLENTYKALKGSFDGAYQNYIDAEEPDFMKVYYPGIEDQLKNVKTKYDPEDKFNFEFSIPTNNQSKKRSKKTRNSRK
ncbi:hypothetical protein DSO57_1004257 [Entomophthora muscae]|uniref:Uncharacterized protein n=1 Tax=Entomophthora muscae TaxID=34485 RepID=A0ACC2RZD7_9FUNG|nr:hypothetical protein DSO57_1004257 [Entomophthora muscae]